MLIHGLIIFLSRRHPAVTARLSAYLYRWAQSAVWGIGSSVELSPALRTDARLKLETPPLLATQLFLEPW